MRHRLRLFRLLAAAGPAAVVCVVSALSALSVLSALSGTILAAERGLHERLGVYFAGWYAAMPGTHVIAAETREITVPGFSAWRITRHPDAGATREGPEESSLAIYDAGKDQVFLGEILHDPERVAAKRPFEKGADLGNMRASLQELFGLPVRVEMAQAGGGGPAGLLALTVLIQQAPEAFVSRPGFVSTDGATVLLGEFRPLSEDLAGWREKLLAERPGIRVGTGRFVVTELLDFQCERCKRRTPEGRRAASESGGALEVRFFPLVKQHEWSFVASELAAALAAVGSPLYARFEETVFARQDGMTALAARELAADIADAAGSRAAFDAELASGRARNRVLRDIELGARIGAHGTPLFVLDGHLVPGQRGFLENALFLSRGKPAAVKPTARPGSTHP